MLAHDLTSDMLVPLPLTMERSPGALAPREEIPVIHFALILTALGFLGLFIVLPLIVVFSEALQKGIGFYFGAFAEPAARAAIHLTLLTAAIAVPANLVFGVSAAWCIAKFI